MTHTTTDAAEARAQEVLKAHKLDRRLTAFGQANVIAAMLAFATAEAASGAGEREGSQPPKPSWCGCYPDRVDGLDYICDRHLELGVASLPPATDPAMVAALEAKATWFRFNAGTGEYENEYCSVKPHDASGFVTMVPLSAALAAAPTIPATGEAVPKPLRVDWNKHDLAEAYDLVEGVRSKMAQSPESPLDTSLRAALDAIEAADCEWDGLTKATIPATGHAATEGEG